MPDHTYPDCQAWRDRIVRDDPGLPGDFLDVAEDIHDWWLSLRDKLVDLAPSERVETSCDPLEGSALVPEENVIFLHRRHRGFC